MDEFDLVTYAITTITSLAITFAMAMYFRYKVRPKIEKTYEKNHPYVHTDLMGQVNHFDDFFKLFYDSFQEKFSDIVELPDGEFLPATFNLTINETGGFTSNPNDRPEHSQSLNRFKELDDGWFKNCEEQMVEEQKEILEFLKNNETYIVPSLRHHVRQYVVWTLFYVSNFRKGWNYSDALQKRLTAAQETVKILRDEKLDNDKSQNDKFIQKWNEYEDSEGMPS